ncbi:MAG TPA: hypothetical protein P5277_01105 [Candidatus Paceibacterota bacterium]|nr:hypothetical protein [Candidatus Paceibacterota bacterium]
MILIISTCKDSLHELEFVKPIEDILKVNNIQFLTISYKNISDKYLSNTDKIIISGTSLADNAFLEKENIKKFDFVKNYDKPMLGICAGAHIVGLKFGGTLKKQKQIGLIDVNFKKEFLGLSGNQEVYNLHGLYSKLNNNFEIFAFNKCPQAFKHKTKEIYGVLFHPEVRQKELIKNFSDL